MNLIIYKFQELESSDSLRLVGERAEHIISVLRVKPGDTLRVGELHGGIGRARVSEVAAGEVLLEEIRLEDFPEPPEVNLIVAMPRPQTLKKVLQTAATMRVKRLMLIRASRVEKSYFSSPLLEPAQLERNLLLGMEQGISTLLPEVSIHDRFRRFVEDEFCSLVDKPQSLLLAEPGAKISLATLAGDKKFPKQRPLTLAVGPEGGWLEFETGLFVERGFQPFSCGPWVLRVETAVAVVLGQIEFLRMIPAS